MSSGVSEKNYTFIYNLTQSAFHLKSTYTKVSSLDIILNPTAVTKSPSHHHEEGTVFPTTPTSAGQGFTPSSEVTNSPFNFEMHSDMIQQLTKSPGDGFLFQSRPMFDHSPMDTERDQVTSIDIFN